MIIQSIPGHFQVFTDSVLTGAFPRFNTESTFTENFLLVATRVSAFKEKHLMIKEEIDILRELQVKAGMGFCLQALQLLLMKVKAEITLERL